MVGWSKKRRIMRRYDLTAQMYDMRYEDEQKAKIETALNSIKMKRLSSVLDVGCGTGILFDYINRQADVIVGLDFSRQTLVQARRRLQKRRLDKLHLIQADADHMPFPGGTFKFVFVVTVLQNLPDPSITLEEMQRVADAKAVFVVTGLKKVMSLEQFQRMLNDSCLKVQALEGGGLKCHVAVCKNY